MELSTIMASKLFRTSPRQGDILRKISSSALQIQVPSQVDAPTRDTKEDTKPQDEDVTVSKASYTTRRDDRAEHTPNKAAKSPSSDMAQSKPVSSPSGQSAELENKSEVDSEPVKQSEPVNNEPSSSEKVSSEEVESSQAVKASSGTPLPTTDVTDHLDLEVESIKSTLNAKDNTSGVSRVGVKDNKEVWVYYNDNVNLNDVMVPVIEQMNASGYTYLEFNRLARSDNAVVFVVLREDTDRRKKPQSEVVEQVKE